MVSDFIMMGKAKEGLSNQTKSQLKALKTLNKKP
jgi:hypothetical protein